jgi:hypothetical protein
VSDTTGAAIKKIVGPKNIRILVEAIIVVIGIMYSFIS